MLPARALAIIATTGGEHMEMGMVLPSAPMRVEDRDVAPRERLPLNGTIEIIQALPPTGHERAQHDRGMLVEDGAEHGRHGQDNVPIDDPLVEDLAHLTHPVVDMDFGAPQAQRRLTAHR